MTATLRRTLPRSLDSSYSIAEEPGEYRRRSLSKVCSHFHGPLTPTPDVDAVIAHVAAGLRLLLTWHSPGIPDPSHSRSTTMSNDTNTVEDKERYDVLLVEGYEDEAGLEKSHWTQIGVGFAHKDGNGLNVTLSAIPLTGKLVIRRYEDRRNLQDG